MEDFLLVGLNFAVTCNGGGIASNSSIPGQSISTVQFSIGVVFVQSSCLVGSCIPSDVCCRSKRGSDGWRNQRAEKTKEGCEMHFN